MECVEVIRVRCFEFLETNLSIRGGIHDESIRFSGNHVGRIFEFFE
ncbi:MAG: hypothetical protein K0R93_2434 [Anaerosolibacter sp.]|jgi:hypothetical protein|nr:hypothetical protein [Anaerosolibacter sp.]